MQCETNIIELRNPIADAIRPYLNKSFNELPAAFAELVTKAFTDVLGMSADPEFDTLTPLERCTRDAGRECSTIAWRWNESTPEQRNHIAIASDRAALLAAKYDEQEAIMASPEYIARWWDESMHASFWWQAESITSIYAALILSGHNPNKGTDAAIIEAAETTTSGGTGPGEFRALKNIFEGAGKDKPRTLKDWMEYAQERELIIHSWLAQWLQVGGAPPKIEPKAAPAIGSVSLGAEAPMPPEVKGLRTSQIVEAFDIFVKFKLGKAMTDRAKWTNDARITNGTKGGRHKSLWSPVIMATALCERNQVPMTKLNQAFNSHAFLADWREEWNRLSSM